MPDVNGWPKCTAERFHSIVRMIPFRTGTRFARELHLDPKDSRPRTPSLLADDVVQAAEPDRSGILADGPEANEAPPPRSRRHPSSPRRYRPAVLFGALGVALVVLLVYAFSGNEPPRHAVETASGRIAGSADMVASDITDDGVAVILPGPHDATAAGQGADRNLASSLPAGASSAAPGSDASVQGRLADIVSGRHAAPKREVVRHPRRTDSDVALLTALIAHVEKGGPGAWEKTRKLARHEDLLELRMQDCPAANTKAGLDCRKRICEGQEGRSPACPAPVPDGKD